MSARVIVAGLVGIAAIVAIGALLSDSAALYLAAIGVLLGTVAYCIYVARHRSAHLQQTIRELKAERKRLRSASGARSLPATATGERQEFHGSSTRWDRATYFGERYTDRRLAEFTEPSDPTAWLTENPYSGQSDDTLLDLIKRESQWRYHHGIEQIAESGALYSAYAARVEAMLEMLDRALALGDVDVPASSFVDLGAAEGYVVNHLLDQGGKDIDAIELNENNIARMWMVRALKRQFSGRIGRLDLERADWSRALGRQYDVALGLGVIYHMENPLLFARNLYAACNRIAIVESDTPVFDNERFRGFGNIYLHRDQVTLRPGDIRYLTEMRPDRQALVEMLLSAGFHTVHAIPASDHAESRYFRSGEKTLMVAVRDPDPF